jgi:uncharacterized coiled-coil protein SlyX
MKNKNNSAPITKNAESIMNELYNLNLHQESPEQTFDPEEHWRKQRAQAFGSRRLSDPITNQDELKELLKLSVDDAQLSSQVAAIKKASEEITVATGFLASELESFTNGTFAETLQILKTLFEALLKRQERLDFLEKKVDFQTNRIEQLTGQLNRLIELQVASLEQELPEASSEKKEKRSNSIASFSLNLGPLSPRSSKRNNTSSSKQK